MRVTSPCIDKGTRAMINEEYYTANQLTQAFGLVAIFGADRLLEEIGWQTCNEYDQWELTEKGKALGGIHINTNHGQILAWPESAGYEIEHALRTGAEE
jgi:hypothetical protein